MGSKAKDASAKIHERNQTILADLLRDEDNRYCADCMAKGPRWASWNLGVFICIRCAGIHRNLGVHISRVKSVNLDAWTPEQMESIQKGGNRQAREMYEANLPANFRRPQDDYAVEQFIRSKYEKKLYMNKGASTSSSKAPSTSSAKSARPVQQDNRLKVKKTHERKVTPPKNEVMSVPRPTGGRKSPSPQPPLSSSSSKQPSSNSLISLGSSPPPSSSASSNSIPGLDLLTDTPTTKAAATKQKPQNAPNLDLLMGPLQSAPLATSAAPSAQQGAPVSFFSNPPGQKQQQQSLSSAAVASQQNFGSSQEHPPLLMDPSLIPEQTKQDVKDSIMSLYSSQPQYGAYTAQGYPVNAYHYNQQQQAAMRMAQVQQLAQQRQTQLQLQQVQQQMNQIKVNQQHHPVAVGNGSFPSSASPGGRVVGGGGGHTLNPHLW